MGCRNCVIYTRMLVYLCTIALHGSNIVVMLYSFTDEAMKIKGVRDFYENQNFFFTCWTFVLQMTYAAFALFCDGMSLRTVKAEKKPLPEAITNFRDKVFTALVWPPVIIVTTYFWAFYAYDRNLIYPEYFDMVVTQTSNHIMHTLIVPLAVCELILYPRRKPDSSIVRVCCVVGLEALYVSALFYTYYTKGIWIYPIFATLYKNKVCLMMFLVFTALYLTVLYYAQFCVSKTVLRCREKIAKRFCKACQ